MCDSAFTCASAENGAAAAPSVREGYRPTSPRPLLPLPGSLFSHLRSDVAVFSLLCVCIYMCRRVFSCICRRVLCGGCGWLDKGRRGRGRGKPSPFVLRFFFVCSWNPTPSNSPPLCISPSALGASHICLVPVEWEAACNLRGGGLFCECVSAPTYKCLCAWLKSGRLEWLAECVRMYV